MNVLKPHLRITMQTLLQAGTSQREIERVTGVDRKTIRRYAHARQIPPGWPPALRGRLFKIPHPGHRLWRRSACEVHRAWIEAQVQLGRNAMSIYQDLVERHGFTHRYNSVKRFVRTLKAREPERFDVLEFLPGEEAQVDYGQGAPDAAGERQVPPAVSVRDDAQVLGQELSQGRVEDRSGDLGAAARAGLARVRRQLPLRRARFCSREQNRAYVPIPVMWPASCIALISNC